MAIVDVAFDDAADVGSIRYRLHPIDVGFDLRSERMPVVIDPADDPLRVSYRGPNGERRVLSGTASGVITRLRELGYVIRVG